MNIKRAFLVLAAVLLMPCLAMAGTTAGTASFTVDVTFIPDTGETTTANISCSGVVAPNDQSAGPLGHDDDTAFLVESIALGLADCDVWVDGVDGYLNPVYSVGGPNGTDDASGCHYDGIVDGEGGGAYTCSAVFTAKDVTFTVTKIWDITLVGGEFVDPNYSITLTCDQDITGDGGTAGSADDCDDSTPSLWCVWDEMGTTNLTFFVDVDATGLHPHCSATESIADSSVATDSDCSSRSIFVGSSSRCTIENTVFFEGIPTLNQYGLAILALLMLGVGFVGFRRFV